MTISASVRYLSPLLGVIWDITHSLINGVFQIVSLKKAPHCYHRFHVKLFARALLLTPDTTSATIENTGIMFDKDLHEEYRSEEVASISSDQASASASILAWTGTNPTACSPYSDRGLMLKFGYLLRRNIVWGPSCGACLGSC